MDYHEVDLTAFMDDYIQIGANSVYAGGSGHPYSSSYYSKYYMITDRMNIQLTDDSGNSWYVNSTTTDGYYDGALEEPPVSRLTTVSSTVTQTTHWVPSTEITLRKDGHGKQQTLAQTALPKTLLGLLQPCMVMEQWRFWAPQKD